MPPRTISIVIIVFWVLTTSVVFYRDFWRHYFIDGPPPVKIELTDEATSQIPAKWTLYRDHGDGLKKIGGASTELIYEPTDDTFWFKSEYRDLKFDVAGFLIDLANVNSDTRITRAGLLKEQRFVGDVIISRPVIRGSITLVEATALITGVVQEKMMIGRCHVWNPKLSRNLNRWNPSEPPVIDQSLEPVPVPDGQVLNPMMPLGRVRGIRAGRSWVIREVNPLADAIALALRQAAQDADMTMFAGSAHRMTEPRRYLARVRPSVEVLHRIPPMGAEPRPPVTCHVIDYDGGEGLRATSWVGETDGTVYRQETVFYGERILFERDY